MAIDFLQFEQFTQEKQKNKNKTLSNLIKLTYEITPSWQDKFLSWKPEH